MRIRSKNIPNRQNSRCPLGQNPQATLSLACGYEGSAFQAVYTQINLHKLYSESNKSQFRRPTGKKDFLRKAEN
ncbi:MAG: hypothetical protein LBG92_02380 [Prevotellaceae bacterium]|jgi:hypothetical protein|nr:hypothetical protein [Prevotellaceae bacterium]